MRSGSRCSHPAIRGADNACRPAQSQRNWRWHVVSGQTGGDTVAKRALPKYQQMREQARAKHPPARQQHGGSSSSAEGNLGAAKAAPMAAPLVNYAAHFAQEEQRPPNVRPPPAPKQWGQDRHKGWGRGPYDADKGKGKGKGKGKPPPSPTGWGQYGRQWR